MPEQLAGFGVDGDATDTHYDAAETLVKRYMEALSAGDWQRAADLCRYPTFSIGVGEVGETSDAASFARELAVRAPAAIEARSIQAVQGGENGVNVAVDFELSGRGGHALLCVTAADGQWGIQGRSIFRD